MEIIGEIFVEIIFRRIIVRFFGYYTLLCIYSLFGFKKNLKLLKGERRAAHCGEEFSNELIVRIVGIISFCLFFLLIAVLYGFIQKMRR